MSLITIIMAGALDPGPFPVTRTRYLMGTLCSGTVASMRDGRAGAAEAQAAGRALEAAFEEIARLESILSDWRADSELSRLNRAAPGVPFSCSPDLFDFLTRSSGLSASTDGAFDLTVGPLVAAWDLRGAGRRPSPELLASARAAVGWRGLRLDAERRTARLDAPGMALDPGAIGKGYALDAAARVLARSGVASAFIDFGGQILVTAPPPGRAAWEIDIAHPLERDEPALTLSLMSGSIATSSNAERAPATGAAGHILDPATGQPVAWRGSVTVVAPTGTEADAWSTALFVMGPEKGLRKLASHPGIEALYLEPDERGTLKVLASPGFPATQPAGRESTPAEPERSHQ